MRTELSTIHESVNLLSLRPSDFHIPTLPILREDTMRAMIPPRTEDRNKKDTREYAQKSFYLHTKALYRLWKKLQESQMDFLG